LYITIYKHILFSEILAPVAGPTNALFLAVQHHQNDEVRILMNSQADGARVNENGYSAIHCACRYNNMYVIDLVMFQGKQKQLPKQNSIIIPSLNEIL
jgi:ankyrin repeat protein